MKQWEKDAIETDVYADEAFRNERPDGVKNYDEPGSLGDILAKRSRAQALTDEENEKLNHYMRKSQENTDKLLRGEK